MPLYTCPCPVLVRTPYSPSLAPPLAWNAFLRLSLPRPMTRMSLYGFAFQPCRACANQPQSRVKKIKSFLHLCTKLQNPLRRDHLYLSRSRVSFVPAQPFYVQTAPGILPTMQNTFSIFPFQMQRFFSSPAFQTRAVCRLFYLSPPSCKLSAAISFPLCSPPANCPSKNM